MKLGRSEGNYYFLWLLETAKMLQIQGIFIKGVTLSSLTGNHLSALF